MRLQSSEAFFVGRKSGNVFVPDRGFPPAGFIPTLHPFRISLVPDSTQSGVSTARGCGASQSRHKQLHSNVKEKAIAIAQLIQLITLVLADQCLCL